MNIYSKLLIALMSFYNLIELVFNSSLDKIHYLVMSVNIILICGIVIFDYLFKEDNKLRQRGEGMK